jgi:putative NADPH-quinone reductase
MSIYSHKSLKPILNYRSPGRKPALSRAGRCLRWRCRCSRPRCEARNSIASANHLLLIFPLWHGTMPALLKTFLEQVLRPGVALEYRERGFPRGLLTRRSARLVVTMGMPALIYRWYFRAHGVRGLERSILRFAGIKPVRETLLGMVETVSDAKRRSWLDRMRVYGGRLI